MDSEVGEKFIMEEREDLNFAVVLLPKGTASASVMKLMMERCAPFKLGLLYR